MAVNIEIKQNPNSPVTLTIPEIAALKQLAYGVSDNNCTLEQGEIGQ